MSMTDLLGSDVDDSEEDENVAEDRMSEGENIKEHSDGSEHSEQEDDNDDEEPEGEEEEEEEEDGGEEEKEKEEDSDERSNEGEEVEEQEADEVEGQEGHTDLNEEDNQRVPADSHKTVSSLDLFGEEVSSEEEEVEKEQEEPEEKKAEDENDESYQRRYGFNDEEDEEEEKAEEETQINVEIPYSKFSLGTDIAFVKLPNFLSVETKPFDPLNYEDEIEEDEVLDEEGRARLKLRVENTIRWRCVKDEDGNEVKESNARVVKWDDGTMSLLLGAEVFDIHKTKIEGEHNHLFVQQGTGLQAQAIFHDKLTFRPHSTNSQTHRKMTLSIADRVSKAGKIKILPVVGKDPESKKTELIKKEEEKLRAQVRRESQQRRMRERTHARGLTASYLEPDRYDDDEDALEQSLLAMKKHYKKGIAKGRRAVDVYSDQESEEEGISGGLESDDESGENSADKGAANSEDDTSRSRKHSFEEGSTKKKRKVIDESDEDESD